MLEKARERLDSQLVLALQQSRSLPPFDKPTTLTPDLVVEKDGRILCDVRAKITETLLQHLAKAGAEVLQKHPVQQSLRARIPLHSMVSLTLASGVIFISPAVQATTNSSNQLPVKPD